MDAQEELKTMLRPAGAGLYVVSTGKAEQEAMQKRLYSANNDTEVKARFEAAIDRVAGARVVVLGIPSDVGAGFLRGANMGPQGIRSTLLDIHPDWPAWCEKRGIVDIGDVFVVPQLLHDEMLSEAQIAASRRALYPHLDSTDLPVSPLSIAERALGLVLKLAPDIKPFVLGGDHSCAWPVTSALFAARPGFGIVQVDAHTDLLAERLGVRICFATWSHHASALIGGKGRMVQVGIRATRHDRAHWETTRDLHQVWADECLRDPKRALDVILEHVKRSNVRGVYFSNDIDGTDERWANATGTPESGGLEPDFVLELIERLGREVGIEASDVMEVAPPVARTPTGARDTLELAARYAKTTLEAMTR
jgi:arginase family enzyme